MRQYEYMSRTKKFYTQIEIAKKLRVSRKTVRRYHDIGMPHMRLSPKRLQYDWTDVMKWMKQFKKGGEKQLWQMEQKSI